MKIAALLLASYFLIITVSPVLSRIYFVTIENKASNTGHPAGRDQQKENEKDTAFTLLFGGDMMGHMSLVQTAYSPETMDYSYLHWFRFVENYVQSADLAVANLEVTLGGKPFTGYPQFSSPDAYARDISKAGFDLLVTSNNHCQDRGRKGLERTIAVLDSMKIAHTGTFSDTLQRKQRYPLLMKVAGTKIAFINATFGTNGLYVEHPNYVNTLDTAEMKNDIIKARKEGADFIISVLHWGEEYNIVENAGQRAIADALASAGCDLIIGMHPHVVEPVRTIELNSGGKRKLVPVVYSLGNFVSSQRKRYTDGGIMMKVFCTRHKGIVKIEKMEYLPFWVYTGGAGEENFDRKKGFYMIPEDKINLLPESEQGNARSFFRDTKDILKDFRSQY